MTAATPPTAKKATHVLDGVEKGSLGKDEIRLYNTRTKKVKKFGKRTAGSLSSDWKTVQVHGDKPEAVLKRVAKLKASG
jgi:hypothetical protein